MGGVCSATDQASWAQGICTNDTAPQDQAGNGSGNLPGSGPDSFTGNSGNTLLNIIAATVPVLGVFGGFFRSTNSRSPGDTNEGQGDRPGKPGVIAGEIDPANPKNTVMLAPVEMDKVLNQHIQDSLGKYGIVTQANGGLMYLYQVEIDGVRVGLPGALGSLNGLKLTSEEFEQRAKELVIVVEIGKPIDLGLPKPTPPWERDAWFEGVSPMSVSETPPPLPEDMVSYADWEFEGQTTGQWRVVEDPEANECRIEDADIVEISPLDSPITNAGSTIVSGPNTAVMKAPLNPYHDFLVDLGLTENSTIQEVLVKLEPHKFEHPKLWKDMTQLAKDPNFRMLASEEERTEAMHRVLKARVDPASPDKNRHWYEILTEYSNDVEKTNRADTQRHAQAARIEEKVEEEKREDRERTERREFVP